MINKLYYETLEVYSNHFDNNQIDFIGLNIDSLGRIECKIYPTPEDNVYTNNLSPFEKSIFGRGMFRCRCKAYSLKGFRTYIALKNKEKANILWLLNTIKNENSNIDIKELIDLSSIRVNDNLDLCYSSIHMIGKKTIGDNDRIINVEWITRYMVDPDEPNRNYEYRDILYLNYIDSLEIKPISELCQLIKSCLLSYIESHKLHLWLVAADYYPTGEKKYKIYFKTNQIHIIELKEAIESIAPDLQEQIIDVFKFLSVQSSILIYGFAIGMDNHNNVSLNFYLINDE